MLPSIETSGSMPAARTMKATHAKPRTEGFGSQMERAVCSPVELDGHHGKPENHAGDTYPTANG